MKRNLLSIRETSVEDIESLLSCAGDYKERIASNAALPDLSRKVVGMLFFEESTRTRVSFEQAARYLGLEASNFATSSSSMKKGESLKDTVLTLRYERLDGLVIRHSSSGAPKLAADFFEGPVLNAGDGRHEHPTQALGDALTIRQKKSSIKGLTVAIVGDVEHSRVARSDAWILSKLGANVRFVGPRTLVPDEPSMLPATVFNDLESGLSGADVVIALRLQRERMDQGLLSSESEYVAAYQINKKSLAHAAPDCLVMHPGPINRGIELDDDVADGPRSVIADQVQNGVYVRMAALAWCFGEGGGCE